MTARRRRWAIEGIPEEFERYERQLDLPGVGREGQVRLGASRVLVVGAGGLGSPVLYYLAAAGIGTLGIADRDTVSVSNLNRQILHAPGDLGRPKTDSARDKLAAFRPDLELRLHCDSLDDRNAPDIVAAYDLVLAAVDSRESRRVINRACYGAGVPWIDGGVDGFEGMVSAYRPPAGPCYECLTRGAPDEPGHVPRLFGALAGTIGLLQVQEALKLLLGIGKPLTGRILFYDALEPRFDVVEAPPDPSCPVCRGQTHPV